MFEGVKFVEAPQAQSTSPFAEIDTRGYFVSRSLFKLGFDILFSSAALLFLLPFFALVAILIKLDSPGPVFFLQQRGGLNGKLFKIYKFRSMTWTGRTDDIVQASQNDKRVTRIGKILRKTSLDELPQLINILRGEMSVVGPRPHAMAHDFEFAMAVPTYMRRFQTRPGLTGLAQVNGLRGAIKVRSDLERRVQADIDYIEHWSFAKDLVIVLKTLPLVFMDETAF